MRRERVGNFGDDIICGVRRRCAEARLVVGGFVVGITGRGYVHGTHYSNRWYSSASGNADPNTRTKNVSLNFDCNINFNTDASLYAFAPPTTHTFYIHLKLCLHSILHKNHPFNNTKVVTCMFATRTLFQHSNSPYMANNISQPAKAVMEYSPAVDKGGRATVPMTTPSPAMESLPAVRSFTTPLEHTTASGSSRQNEEYSGNQHLGTPTTRPFNWRDVYPVDQNAHAFANQDYTLLAGRHTDPLQSTSRFSSFTPDSTRSQPNSQSPIRFTGHQADPAASQVTNETNHYNLLNSPVRGNTLGLRQLTPGS